MRSVFKVKIASGSIVLKYRVESVTTLYSSKRRAKKDELLLAYLNDDALKDNVVSKEDAMKINWLNELLINSLYSITFIKDGMVKSIYIEKVKCE